MKVFVRVALATASLVVACATANAQSVGNASAMIPNASQQPPQGTRSDLRLRDPIIRNAQLATADRGALEVTFLDGSRLTMGQNSRLTVDEYVYSGPGSAGRQTIRYGKGLFRFISGSIPKDQVQIKTPTVTIGIRGTMFRTVVNEDGTGAVSVEYGPGGKVDEVTLTNENGETLVLKSGDMVTFGGPGGAFGGVGGGQIEGCQ